MMKKLLLLCLLCALVLFAGCEPPECMEYENNTYSTESSDYDYYYDYDYDYDTTIYNTVLVTKAQYDAISTGMSYSQIVEVFGGHGALLSEVGSPGDQFYSFCVGWDGSGALGANIILTFSGNELFSKAQYGLQ